MDMKWMNNDIFNLKRFNQYLFTWNAIWYQQNSLKHLPMVKDD